MVTLEDKKASAMAFRKQGYNCAQSVVMPFAAELGMSENQLAAVASAMGGGMAGMREVCGVVTGMAVAEGLHNGGAPTRKAQSYKNVRLITEEFAAPYDGRIRCSELKAPENPVDCTLLIMRGVELLYGKLCTGF